MIINAILFNALWLGLVAIGNPFIPLAIAGLCFHLYIVDQPLHEAKIIAAIAAVGLLTDVLLTFSGIFIFEHTPYWLLVLWLAFASTMNHSLKWVARIPMRPMFAVPCLRHSATWQQSVSVPLASGFPHFTPTCCSVWCGWCCLMFLFISAQ